MTRTSSYFLLFLLLLMPAISIGSAAASEADPLWVPTNGPPGGGFGVLEINPGFPDVIYAGCGYSLFRSGDGGDAWERVIEIHKISETLELGVRGVEFNPIDPETVYVCCRGGLFKSTDNGLSWDKKTGMYDEFGARAMTIDPGAPETIYTLVDRGDDHSSLLKSMDGGDTWANLTSSLPSNCGMSVLKAVACSRLFAGGGSEMARRGQLYESNDGGSTWSEVNIGQGEDTFPSTIEVDPNDPGHIYIGFADAYNRGRLLDELLFESFDCGSSWRAVTGGEIGSIVLDIEISTNDPDLIYYQSPLHRSRDGGETWERIRTCNYVEDFGSVEQNSIAVHPEDDDVLFATLMGQGIAKSTDGGATWRLSTDGLVSTFVTNIAVDPVNQDVVYCSGGDGSGTWKTTDGGRTWTILNKGGIHHPWVDELTIDPSDSDVLYNIADVGYIFRSRDAGMTWEKINNGFNHESIYALEADPGDPDTLYAMCNGFGMFKTEDAGRGWRYLLYSPDYSYSIAIDPSDTSIIYSGYNKKEFETGSRVYRSLEGGEDWEVVLEIPGSDAVTSVVVDGTDPKRVYAGSTGDRGCIYYSDDKGDSWQRLNDDFIFSAFHTQDQLVIDPSNEDIAYAAPWGAGFFKTVDGGVSWAEVSSSPTISVGRIEVDETDPNVIYVADRTSPTLYRSDDGGVNWYEFFDAGPRYSRLVKVKIDPNDPDVLYVSAFEHNAIFGSLFRIEDGQPFDITNGIPRSVIDIEVNPTNSSIIYVSLHGENVYKTVDGGENWDILHSLPIVGVFDIEIDWANPSTVYAAATEGRGCPPELLNPELFPPVAPEDVGAGGVYKTLDGGETWERCKTPDEPFKAISVHPGNSDILFGATTEGIYISSDQGSSWTPQNEGLSFLSIGSLDVGPERIYAGSRGGGAFVGSFSSGNGISWNPTNGPYPEIYNIQLEVDPTDSDVIYASSFPGGMFKSVDRGMTWEDMNFFMPSFEVTDPVRQGYYKFGIDLKNPQRMVFGIYGRGVYASSDGSASQMPLFGERNEMRGAEVTNVAMDPMDSDTIFVATSGGVYVTRDGGGSYQAINEGLIVDDIMTLTFNRNGDLYAGSKGYGVYRLRRGESVWEGPFRVQNFGVYWHVWDRPLYLYNALLINPFDSNIMYLGTFPTGFYKTSDGGSTWREINTNFSIDGAFSMAFHPYNKTVILAGTYNGVSRSDDSGETWRKWSDGMPPELWVFSIVFNPLNPDIVYAAAKNGENKGSGRDGFRGTILKSTNGGRNWFEITDGLDLNNEYYQLVIYPYNYDVLFASSGCGVYMTEDGGESWTTINSGLVLPGGLLGSGIVNNVANNLALDAEGRYLYLGTMGRGTFRADLEKLGIEEDPDALPLSCFNCMKDGDEVGIDAGGSCAVPTGGYAYGIDECAVAMVFLVLLGWVRVPLGKCELCTGLRSSAD